VGVGLPEQPGPLGAAMAFLVRSGTTRRHRRGRFPGTSCILSRLVLPPPLRRARNYRLGGARAAASTDSPSWMAPPGMPHVPPSSTHRERSVSRCTGSPLRGRTAAAVRRRHVRPSGHAPGCRTSTDPSCPGWSSAGSPVLRAPRAVAGSPGRPGSREGGGTAMADPWRRVPLSRRRHPTGPVYPVLTR
jgi:hypothetical protein